MSVQTQIDRIKTNVASAYEKAQMKGATLPADQNTENLANTIESIPDTSLPEGIRTITLTADPPEGGTVTGGGMSSDGMTVTINAEANEVENYYFDSWKEDDAPIHADPIYTFGVSKDRSLIASFLQAQYAAGVDWLGTTLPFFASWAAVAYGNGKFVAIASSKEKAAYSSDGINWSETTLPSSNNWKSITYGNGKFVAIAENHDKSIYSADGITWNEATLPLFTAWNSVTYGNGNGRFVVLTGGRVNGIEGGLVA